MRETRSGAQSVARTSLALTLVAVAAAGCSANAVRAPGGSLFASNGTAPIESRDLAPLNGTSALPAGARGPIVTPPSLKERGWTVEGAPIVEVTSADTPQTLSRGFGVPVGVILEANGLTNPSEVRAGQRLVIPTYVYEDKGTAVASAPQALAPASTLTDADPPSLGAPPTTLDGQKAEGRHVVQPGDTLFSIAQAHRVAVIDLARLNSRGADGAVRVGETLRVPPATTVPPADGRVAALEPSPPVAESQPETPPAQASTAPAPVQEAAPAPADAAQDGFRWPVRGRIIAGFGKQADGARNDGINVAVPAGTPVQAAEAGTVIYAGNELEGYGNLVLVQHADDWVSAYAHNENLKVSRGDTVSRGQAIATVGATGSVDQPQLHFELRRRSKPVDPLPHLAKG